MKKILLSLVAVLVCAMSANADIYISSTTFPDATFRNKVKAFDTNNDNYLSDAEIRAVETMDVSDLIIFDLTGIEYFSALHVLNCAGNELTSLDLSQNFNLNELNCNYNRLTSIILPAYKVYDGSNYVNFVQKLSCNGNDLTDIGSITNLKYCSYLTIFECGQNYFTEFSLPRISNTPALTRLQLLYCRSNTLLTDIEVAEQDSLWAIDVAGCTALKYLNCYDNNLTSLDLSSCTALEGLYCQNNQFRSLPTLPSSLKWLDCSNNQLTSLPTLSSSILYLNVSRNKFTSLSLSGISTLRSLDVSKNHSLTSLDCYDNALTNLYVSNCSALTSLNCKGNQLTELDASWLNQLTSLDCYDNALYYLNVSNCSALTSLNCSGNQLTYLDVSDLSSLRSLNARDNLLTSVNLSGCSEMSVIQLQNNKLASLSVEDCNYLRNLYITRNKIKGDNMTVLVNSLPHVYGGAPGLFGVLAPDGENNEITPAQVDIAHANRWRPLKWEDGWVEIPGTEAGGILGDLNNDEVVDVDDMNIVINIILSQGYDSNADLNGDNVVDVDDMNMVINIILTSH